MSFRKYDHVERLGHDKVEAIEIGNVYVFPKLDGTNGSVWFDGIEWHGPNAISGHNVKCGSRTRELSDEKDNAGFFQWVHAPENNKKLLDVAINGSHNWVIYGEWLVPHTLKTYREDAWRRFYVFDVYDRDKKKYLPYDEYEPIIKAAGLDIIEPLCIFSTPSHEQLHREAELNTYLIMDGAGVGEGIVIKNYEWSNCFNEQPWAKIVRNDFKEENRRAFGTTEKGGEKQVEGEIAEEFCTKALVDKTRAKILAQLTDEDVNEGREPSYGDQYYDALYFTMCREREKRVQERHRAKLIPRLLGTVYHEVIEEELWTALRKHKDPTINFKKLRSHCIILTKRYAADLF